MFNFFPTKAEEEAAAAAASSSTAAAAASSSEEENKWTITKKLLFSDVDMVKKKLLLPKGGPGGVEDNILCYLRPEIAANAVAGVQQFIKMKDVDTGDIIPNMTISKEQAANKFYIKGHWMPDFVQRRDLQKDDKIGLRWNVEEHYLEFSKLDKDYVLQ